MRFFYFILFLINTLSLIGQQPRFDHFDISDGLSQNTVYSLEIDEVGYVWVGTLNGLNRYDGYEFEVFKSNSAEKGSFLGSKIACVESVEGGDVWILSNNGELNRYVTQTGNFTYYEDNLFKGFHLRGVLDISSSDKNKLWLLNQSSVGLFEVNSRKMYTQKLENPMLGLCKIDSNKAFVYGRHGIVKLEIIDGGLDTINCYSGEVNGLSLIDKHIIGVTPIGVVVFDGMGRVADTIVDFSTIKHKPTFENRISLDKYDNEIWLGSSNGLIRYTIGHSKCFSDKFTFNASNPYSIVGHVISAIKFDKAGNLWVGTSKHGLNLYNRSRNQFRHINWKYYSDEESQIDPVRAIHKTKNGNIWLGFDRQGIGVIYNTGTQNLWQHYFDKEGQKHSIAAVRAVYEDSENTIWVGLRNNICYFDRVNNIFRSIDCKYNFQWPHRTYIIRELEDGKVFFTGTGKIGIYDLQSEVLSVISHKELEEDESAQIRDLAYTRNKELWIAFDHLGIDALDSTFARKKTINAFNSQLSDNKVYALALKDNDLWVATNNGLNRYDLLKEEIVKTYFEKDGLSNDIVYSVHADNFNTIWLSTNRGISRLDLKTNKISRYLQNDFFMDDAWYYGEDGEIYYGGYTGVVAFRPEEIVDDSVVTEPRLEQFFLQNEKISPGDLVNDRVLLTNDLDQLKELKLKYYQNTFSFRYNCFPFNYPNTFKYRYQLSNWQKNWYYPSENNRLATFTNVKPGNYTLYIQVADENALWSNSKVIKIIIQPPFWETILFKISFIILFIFLIFLLIRIRHNRIKNRNAWLEKKVNEQTADLVQKNEEIQVISEKLHEADQARLRFFTNISHDFRTPLTLILGYLEGSANLNTGNLKARIRNNALRLLRLVNQLIEFRKIDQDQLKLSVSKFNIVPFLKEITESFKVLSEPRAISLQFLSDVKGFDVWLDLDKMDKILFNLISNAIKYTPDGRAIIVRLCESEKNIIIQVIDQGVGISDKEKEKIFNRFYRTEKSLGLDEGHGIGLAIVKGLTDIQQGRISVEAKEGEGSCFQLSFKKGKEHFSAEDFKTAKFKQLEVEGSAIPNTTKTAVLSNTNILLLEDNDELALFIADLLDSRYSITRVKNGLEGLKEIEKKKPDLIISDIMMPLLDGIQFSRKLKEKQETSAIPIILLTARTEVEIKIEGFKLGVDAFIEKPFNPQEFVVRVEALVRNRQLIERKLLFEADQTSVNQAKLSAGDLEFWNRVNQLIEKHYKSTSFNTEKLCEIMHMSRTTFYRKFKGLTRLNAADYIREYRIKKGAELLEEGELTVAQVCQEVGYQSHNQFRAKFREFFGKTPSKFQNKW